MVEPLVGATIGSSHMMALLRCQEFSSEDVESRVELAMKLVGIECTKGGGCREVGRRPIAGWQLMPPGGA